MKLATNITTMTLLLLAHASTFALSQTVLITPERTDLGHIRFSLEGETRSDRVIYVATITLPEGMRGIFLASLCRVHITDQEKHIRWMREIVLRRTEQGFAAEFDIPTTLLRKEGISLVVSENHERMPNATFYILNLGDFPPNSQNKSP